MYLSGPSSKVSAISLVPSGNEACSAGAVVASVSDPVSVASVAEVSEVDSDTVVVAVVSVLDFDFDCLLIADSIQTNATRSTINTVARTATVLPSARSCAVIVLLGFTGVFPDI